MIDSTYENVKRAMTYKAIPPGQLRLYKALFDAGPAGLSFEQLTRSSDCTAGETRSTLGALGNRVTEALGRTSDRPSQLLIERGRTGSYTLSPTLQKFIANTPSLQEALQNSSMEMFYLHTRTAYCFVWDVDKTEGQLVQFERV